MRHVGLPDIDPSSLEFVVGPTSYARGVQYARQGAVRRMWWDDKIGALRGYVRGSHGEQYGSTVFFSPAGGQLIFEWSQCSCPVGLDCKHAVALVLTAANALAAPTSSPGAPDRPAWEQSLESLLEPAARSDAGGSTAAPAAIELTLVPANVVVGAGYAEFRPGLLARLMRPGKNGWVSGNLSWAQLDSPSLHDHFRADHLRLLGEIYGIYRSQATRWNFYAYSSDKSIDLAAFDSRQLWPLLDEAESIGLQLVYAHKLGAVPKYESGEFCLDITRGSQPSEPLVIRPVLRIDGAQTHAVVAGFIGSSGHGVVYIDGAEAEPGFDLADLRFRLAKLAKGVPAPLQRIALGNQPLTVPRDEETRFAEGYYLRLQQATTVISSDGSFEPPQVSGPILALRASYAGGHELEASWEWVYQVGSSRLGVVPEARLANTEPDRRPDGAVYRDPEAEQAILASLELPLERFGLLPARRPSGSGRDVNPSVWLSGIDTVHFSTELLPLLENHPDADLEVTGELVAYREVGDSLRIEVSVDEPAAAQPGQAAAETDWFDLGITIAVEGRVIPFIDVFTALSRGEPYLLLDDGAYFSLEKPELQNLAGLIDEARALQDAQPGQLRISRFQAGLWEELAELGVVSHQAAAWQRQVEGLLSAGAVSQVRQPAALRTQLRPYQIDGFAWMAFLWEHGLGGILADDMGLGKTVQSLALLCHAKSAVADGPPFLIVAPTSVVSNWAAEAARFAPHLKVVSITDTTARRGTPLKEVTTGADAVVTSYTLLRIDYEAYAACGWSGLILDEAQNTKNHQAKIYQCVRKLPAPFKVAITGTPMENNLMELWSLLSITAPGLFPNPEKFRDYYARPIENGGANRAELLAQLRRRIKPLVRRRTKEQVVADLPAKQEQVLEVELHPKHRRVYQTHLQRERQKVLGLINDLNEHRFTILRSLTLLRQLSLHAGLVDDAHFDVPSAKIDALLEHLRHVTGSGHKALVFSQFTGFLGLVRRRLDLDSVPYCYLDGSTRDRDGEIRRFKAGAAPVFLISLRAGGFGLNLTEADYCFLLDPWWNPATEAQAVDRTHRIGQTRNVMVYRLIAKDTIEEKVMALKARKADLFASVLDSGNVFGSRLSAEDIRGLFA
jgi:superfamily II DNA or RNA helicase